MAGSEKRIKELRDIFNLPDRYGKGLDWTGYTVHDAANILRRFIRELPEPVIPLGFYERFRDPIRGHQSQAVGDQEHQEVAEGIFDNDGVIKTYQQLITELPPLNRQLLLYVLDLLAVFASKSDMNRMTSVNLSAIFQPGLLNNPEHHQAPQEYRLSQDVLTFLIEKQDNFLVGMQGTAADSQTIEEIKSATPPPQSVATASPVPSGLGRSASTASARSGPRRADGVRRHVSVGSKHSRHSNHTPSPGTPPPASSPYTPKGSGLHRSNTVPSKRGQSPALGSERYTRSSNTPTQPTNAAFAALVVSTPAGSTETAPESKEPDYTEAIQEAPETQERESNSFLKPFLGRMSRDPSQERQGLGLSGEASHSTEGPISNSGSPATTPARERGLSSFFKPSAASDAEKKDGRKPNKLQKKRPDGGVSPHSSTHSLLGSRAASPMLVPHPKSSISSASPLDGQNSEVSDKPLEVGDANRPATEPQDLTHTEAAPVAEPSLEPTTGASDLKDNPSRQSGVTLRPNTSRPSSTAGDQETAAPQAITAAPPADAVNEHLGSAPTTMTRTTTNDEAAVIEDESRDQARDEKRSFWRFASPTRREGRHHADSSLSATGLGSSTAAERSTSSVGSMGRPRKSLTDESHSTTVSGAALGLSEPESMPVGSPPEKKGPLGWIRGKLAERKEERVRAKSPPPAEEGREALNIGGIAMEGREVGSSSTDNAPEGLGDGREEQT